MNKKSVSLICYFFSFKKNSDRIAGKLKAKQQPPEQVEQVDIRKIVNFHLGGGQRVKIDKLFCGVKNLSLRCRGSQDGVNIAIRFHSVAALDYPKKVLVDVRLRRFIDLTAEVVKIMFETERMVVLKHVLFEQQVQVVQHEARQIMSEKEKPKRKAAISEMSP